MLNSDQNYSRDLTLLDKTTNLRGSDEIKQGLFNSILSKFKKSRASGSEF